MKDLSKVLVVTFVICAFVACLSIFLAIVIHNEIEHYEHISGSGLAICEGELISFDGGFERLGNKLYFHDAFTLNTLGQPKRDILNNNIKCIISLEER